MIEKRETGFWYLDEERDKTPMMKKRKTGFCYLDEERKQTLREFWSDAEEIGDGTYKLPKELQELASLFP